MVVAVHLYTMKEPESNPKTLYTKSDYTPNIILTKETKGKKFT
jgi:hypothetical protein